MRTVNQQHLAKLLKLSRTTVSRSLSNHPAIAAETRALVQSKAEELGYRSSPTRAVRRPRQAKPITVGVLIGRPLVQADQSTFPLILQGIRRRAAIDHVAVDVVSIDPAGLAPETGRREIFRHIREAGWRGAVLIYPFPSATVEMIARKISTVSVLTEYADVSLDVIDTDHTNVQFLVARLAELGHRRIGFVSWHYPVGGLWAPRRFAAYAQALFQQGLPFDSKWVINIHASAPRLATPSAIAEAVAGLLRRDNVTAWICAADHQAYQLIADLQTLDVRVPRDCSITGFDGNEPPPGLPVLTTLSVPNEDIGASAIARLLSRLLQPTSPRRKTLVETALIPGATIASPPAAATPAE